MAVHTDTFTDTDEVSLADHTPDSADFTWGLNVSLAEMVIRSNALDMLTLATQGYYEAVGLTDANDAELEIDLFDVASIGSTQGFSLVLQATGTVAGNTGYLFYVNINDSDFECGIYRLGVFQVGDFAAPLTNGTYTLRAAVNPDTGEVSLLVNEVVLFSFVDGSPLTGGLCGVGLFRGVVGAKAESVTFTTADEDPDPDPDPDPEPEPDPDPPYVSNRPPFRSAPRMGDWEEGERIARKIRAELKRRAKRAEKQMNAPAPRRKAKGPTGKARKPGPRGFRPKKKII